MNGTSKAQALRREQARGTEEGNKALAWGDFCCVLFCFEIILWALFTSKRKKKAHLLLFLLQLSLWGFYGGCLSRFAAFYDD